MLEEEAALFKGVEGSQVTGSKCKKVVAGDEEGQQFSKKAREKQPEKYYVLLFICLAYVSLHALFVFDITFFPSGLISLYKIGLYISLHYNCSTDIHNIVVVFYED